VVLSDSGFAHVTRQQMLKSAAVTLQPWAKVQGKLMAGEKALGGDWATAWAMNSARSPAQFDYLVKTGADGVFVLDRVIPGATCVSRAVLDEGVRGERDWPRNVGLAWQANLPPGQTTNVQIGGGGGRTLTGKFVIPPAVAAQFAQQRGAASTYRLYQRPPQRAAAAADGADAAPAREPVRYFILPAPSGAFRLIDVIPGSYDLLAEVMLPDGDRLKRAASAWIPVEVKPVDPSKPQDATTDIGEVALK